MSLSNSYTREERAQIQQALRSGEPALCPRCSSRLTTTEVKPDPAVAYVRKRVLVVCGQCHASVALDVR